MAYLRQARSDLACYFLLNDSGFEECHQLHFLQMATEKFARSRLADATDGEPPRSHIAFLNWLKLARTNDKALMDRLGLKSREAERSFIDGLKVVGHAIESLAPNVADVRLGGANPEYPWPDANGRAVSPLDHQFSQNGLGRPALIRIVRFVDLAISHYGGWDALRR